MTKEEFDRYVTQGGKDFVVVLENNVLKKGDIMRLKEDDGTTSPLFYHSRINKDMWCCVSYLQPAIPQKLAQTQTHYDGKVQPIELMQAQMTPEAFEGYLRGNIIKYTSRYGKKDEKIKEAKKILVYAQWLLDKLEGKTIKPN